MKKISNFIAIIALALYPACCYAQPQCLLSPGASGTENQIYDLSTKVAGKGTAAPGIPIEFSFDVSDRCSRMLA